MVWNSFRCYRQINSENLGVPQELQISYFNWKKVTAPLKKDTTTFLK